MNEHTGDGEGVHGPGPMGALPLHQPIGNPAHASDTISRDSGIAIRVVAQPYPMPEQSSPVEGRYIFGYRVQIQNTGDTTVQLMTRHWVIGDSDGHTHDVQGEGVVGRQPRLHPGEGFTYESFVPIETPWGTMEGWLYFEIAEGADTGAPFTTRVDRFFLVADEHDRVG